MKTALAAIILFGMSATAHARCWNGENVSWYVDLHTATGERYSHTEPTCAHRTAKFGTRLRVTEKHSRRSVVCRVNDRGPNKWTRCTVDLNKVAARKLGIIERGVTTATVETVETQIVAHPAGCPARAFCGCGASIEVFGRSIRDLWLARNWLRFPPAEPAPGMVAVRRHHVFVIRQVIRPGLVLAYDANSGGRQTRIHLRSLAGYSVRDPRGRG